MSTDALFSQLLLGLINGSFYALLSLGLALIFGLLNVINFAHGALFTTGAFTAWLLLDLAGVGYWPALVLAPLLVGTLGVIIERTLLRRLYGVDPLYGLLLTFGLALIIQGLFSLRFGSSEFALRHSDVSRGRTGPRFRGAAQLSSVGHRLLIGAVLRHLVSRREDEAGVLPARGHGGPGAGACLWRQCPEDEDAHVWCRSGARRPCRRARRAHLSRQPDDGRGPDHRGIRRENSSSGEWAPS